MDHYHSRDDERFLFIEQNYFRVCVKLDCSHIIVKKKSV